MASLTGLVLLTGCGSDGGAAQAAGATGPASSAGSAAPAPTSASEGAAATTQEAQASTSGASTSAADVDSVQTDAPPAEAALVMTFAEYSAGTGSIDASAFAQGLVESGGTCVLSATRDGGAPLTGTATPAEPGPGTTDCGSLGLDLPADGSGTWTATVGYESDSTSLTSNAMDVEVP